MRIPRTKRYEGEGGGLIRRCPMRFEPIFLICLMMLVPLTPFVEPSEAVSARAQPCGGSVCINEVMPNPNGYDDAAWPNGEWLELYNGGTASVDVRNWYFSNKASTIQ